MCKITYFTPTYNRENLLPRVYDSLLSQTDKNFIWLIVDDGSVDGTKKLVESWQKANKINIKYVYKDNGGKHTAIDLAHQVCTTEFICCCDSDDKMSKDATEVIYRYIEQYRDDKELLGFVGRVCDFNGNIIGFKGQIIEDCWPKQSRKVGFYELQPKFNYLGETVLVFKTEIVKNYHFPVFEGERFVTESVLYKQFMYSYKMATMAEFIHPIEYQQDGYTTQGMDLFFKNPKGLLYRRKQDAYCQIKYEIGFIKKLQRATMYYVCKSGLGIKEDIGGEFKIKFPFNMLGSIAKIFFVGSFKRKYKEFLLRQQNKQ